MHNYLNKTSNTIHYIGIGILTYSIGIFIALPLWSTVLELIGLCFVIYNFIINNNFTITNKFISYFLGILLTWNMFCLLRGIPFTLSQIKNTFIDQFYCLPYFIPLILYWGINNNTLKKIIQLCTISNVIYLFFVILNIPLLITNYIIMGNNGINLTASISENTSKCFGLTNGFLLLIYPLLSKKTKILSIFVLFLNLFISIQTGRRNLIFTIIVFCLFSVLIYLIETKNIKKRIKTIFIILMIGAISVNYIIENAETKFGILNQRLNEDMFNSREKTTSDFEKDFDFSDWIFGRGMFGTFYSPNVQEGTDYRYVIESGLYQIILKTGLIGLVTTLIILIYSSILGIFYSNNHYTKACGYYILIGLLDLLPSGVPAFNLRFIMLWLCVGICIKIPLRKSNNLQVNNYLKILKL